MQTPSEQVNSSELQELKKEKVKVKRVELKKPNVYQPNINQRQPEGEGDSLVLSAAGKISAHVPNMLS